MFRKIKAFLVFYKPQSRLKLKSGNLYFKSTLDFLTTRSFGELGNVSGKYNSIYKRSTSVVLLMTLDRVTLHVHAS